MNKYQRKISRKTKSIMKNNKNDMSFYLNKKLIKKLENSDKELEKHFSKLEKYNKFCLRNKSKEDDK